MGLDISLIRITKEPIDKLNWLVEEHNPELKELYSEFLTERVLNFEDGDYKELGYYYDEISYQRKGVKSSFAKRYKPDEIIFTIEELLELKNYISDKNIESFQTDFIEKFKEKDTLIIMGY